MSAIPDSFETYEDYMDWLDTTVEDELREFLNRKREPIEDEVEYDRLQSWIAESPTFAEDDWKFARLYDDVKQHSDVDIPGTQIMLPYDDPWPKIAQAVRGALIDDAISRAQEMLVQRGYEVKS